MLVQRTRSSIAPTAITKRSPRTVARQKKNKTKTNPCPLPSPPALPKSFSASDDTPKSLISPRKKAFDLQSRRQPLYEYVAGGGGDPQQQRQQQQQQQAQTPTGPSSANYYGSGSPRRRSAPRHKRSPEPRRAYSNYGFRPEMREVQGAAYVVPRVNVEDSDVSRTQRSPVRCTSTTTGPPAAQARYAPVRGPQKPSCRRYQSGEPDSCLETELYVEDRLSPAPHGPDEVYPVTRSPSPRHSPTQPTIREEEEVAPVYALPAKITRF